METVTLSATELAGEYRVAGIDGGEVEGDMGIGLTIADGVISYEPQCLGFVWTLADGERGLLEIARHLDYQPEPRPDGTVVVCQPAVTPAFYELATAFDVVDRAVRTPANGIEFTGGGHSVTLFSQ
ncbi:hypothetical protein M3P36_01600 [Altererythrobacter sp. KTW20L]|uniref:hypothetical protein n=1 Tax=Altererythrobacter sp. KTW20L TaxID=2942210 RepID=UPI0020C18736|nr:hypothetical protein [Altererythrobacter sp. KTW20L]MCL6249743.1 hypothetical protein [Altererythrobacter sp. KTW20L]